MDKKKPAPPTAPSGWRTRWVAWRNRVLASESFQSFAARTPLLRPVARRKATALFDLLAGFTYTQTLLAFVESGLLDLLGEGPCDVSAIASRAQLSPAAAQRLVRAAVALDLAEEVAPGWWTLGQQGAALSTNAGALAMVRHHALLYADLSDPLALLRQDRVEPTTLSEFWRYAARENPASQEADAVSPYSQLMAASQAMVAKEVMTAYDFNRHDSVLDIGGGHGAFLKALAERFDRPRLGLMDLPGVIEGARRNCGSLANAGRVEFHPGSFFDDPIPPGYQCITLVRILHDHDDEPALRLLSRIRTALAPGSRLLIAEPMAATRGAEAMGDAYFGMYLWAMRSGRPRRRDEIDVLLKAAGFAPLRMVRTSQPVVTSLCVTYTLHN